MECNGTNFDTAAAGVQMALLLLLVPLRWILACIVAALIHEFGHYVAVKLCGGKVRVMGLRAAGAYMQSTPLCGWKAIVCMLAGPLAGVASIMVARWFPRIAVCACVQSLFNLIPVRPLDGGCILHALLSANGISEKICLRIEQIILVLLAGSITLLCVCYRLGVFPLLFLGYIVLRTDLIKTPCKPKKDWL